MDLSKAESGPSPHDLYVMVVSESQRLPNDIKSRELTLRTLSYITERLATFKEMGVQVKVHKVRKSDLQNSAVRAAMKGRGITNLPALVTPNQTYIGVKEIIDVYEKNIKQFSAWRRRDEDQVSGAMPEDVLDEYYRREMNFDRAKQDESEGGDGSMGETSGMMDAYRQMVQRRESYDAQRGKSSGIPGPPGGGSSARGGAQALPAAGSRRDNVGGNDDEIGNIDSLISRMAGDIDSQTVEAAFAGSGGDSFEDTGGAGNAQDDLMEKTYWANQELTNT